MSNPDGTLLCGARITFKGVNLKATGIGEYRKTREVVQSTNTESPTTEQGLIVAEYLASCIENAQPIRVPVIYSAAHKDLFQNAMVGTGTMTIALPAEFQYEAMSFSGKAHCTEVQMFNADSLSAMLAGEFVFQPTGVWAQTGGSPLIPDAGT